MSKKILVMPDGNFLSHTSRPFEIAKKLREHGYTVIFAGNGQYMKLPRDAGFRVIPLVGITHDRVLNISRQGLTSWYGYKLIKQCVQAEKALFDREKPDLVLSDFRLSVSTSCELTGIPMAMVLNAAWTNYYSVPVRAPEHLLVARLVGKRIGNFLAPVAKQWILSHGNRGFNRCRRELGLPRRSNIYDTWRGTLNLMTDIPAYAPTTGLPPNFHYIGPIIWEPDMKPPSWLDNLKSDIPTIYFTMGSTGYPRFFLQAIELFGTSPYQCIMTTAGMVTLSSIPDNFHVVDFAPGGDIMKKSDVVVCQGGNGTIYQAMTHGVPVIGIPTMHDQEFNLDRVEALGMGIQLSERNFTLAQLSQAVEKILSQKEYARNACACREMVSNYNGPKTGANIIAAFLDSR